MGHLTDLFSPIPVSTFESHGWESKALESIAFGVLAYQTVMEQYGNVPSVTGATAPRLLGSIVPSGPGWLDRLRPRGRRK